jgi:ABC-2 type transport system ATP-binding protein
MIGELVSDGTTVVLTTQYLEEADRLASRVAVVDHGRVIATGSMAEILGQDGAVRVRVTGLAPDGRDRLKHYGALQDEGEWLTFRGIAPDHVPELVADIVREGGRVYAVEPRHETLEDRFLQLLKEQGD